MWDPALGGNTTGAYLARNRWYSPNLGRWVSRDPVGYRDSINLYLYVHASPLLFADPLGYGLWKLIYTGDWNATDETYEAAVSAAGEWYFRNSFVTGGYASVGVTVRKGQGGKNPKINIGASATVGWTVDGGTYAQCGADLGKKTRGRDPRTGQFASDSWGFSVGGSYSEEGGADWYAALNDSQSQSGKKYKGGGAVGVDTAGGESPTFSLGLNFGFASFGIIIDPTKIDNYIQSVCGCQK